MRRRKLGISLWNARTAVPGPDRSGLRDKGTLHMTFTKRGHHRHDCWAVLLRILAIVLVSDRFALPAMADTPEIVWQQVSVPAADRPPARWGGQMVYDAQRDEFVMFGGAAQADGGFSITTLLNDTWVFTRDSGWVRKRPARSPAPRRDFGLAYDLERGRAVLFGGLNGLVPGGGLNALGDLWEWDGTDWHEITPSVSPGPNQTPLLTYDAGRRRTVLFGGRRDGIDLDETWEWDGTVWQQKLPSVIPPARRAGRITFDEITNRVVLFGGYSDARGFLNDTWEWDGNTWTQRSPSHGPPGRELQGQTYGPAVQAVMLFGGGTGDGSPPLGDIWVWQAADWIQAVCPEPCPPARTRFQMAGGRGVVLVFGGIANTPYSGPIHDDTWMTDPPARQLSVAIAGAGSGTVASEPDGITCPSDCSQTYPDGTAVTLDAMPAWHSVFSGWSGDPECSAVTFTIETDISCVAAFAPAFRPVRRSQDVDLGPDLGGTGHIAMNLTGSAGARGDTWLTVFDAAAEDTAPTVFSGNVNLSADVLIHRKNNRKGAGLLVLYNEAPGKKGLALIVYDGGNTDTLVLATVDQAGKLSAPLKQISLARGITLDHWYRLSMDMHVTGPTVTVTGVVFRHAAGADPNSPLGSQVGPTLTFSGPRPAGVDDTGEVGIIASAFSATVDSSVANFKVAQ